MRFLFSRSSQQLVFQLIFDMKKGRLIFPLLLFFGCIEENPAVYDEKLVVYASLTAGFPMGVLGDTCTVSLSADIAEEKDPQSLLVSDAFVTIQAVGEAERDTLFPVPGFPGRYLPRPSVIFEPGKTYRLEVNWGKYTVYGETTVPEKIEFFSPSGETYICGGEERVVDVINTDNFDITWLQQVESFEEVLQKIDFTKISTAIYKNERCYVGSFASFPLFFLNFNSEDYNTIQVSSFALEGGKRGLEPFSENSSSDYFDYNRNGIRDSTFVNLIYDTTLLYQLWKDDYLRLENGDPYRINPFQWQVVESPVPMSWLFFNYYGLHLITLSATDEAYYNYYSGDPVAQNQFLLPQGNIVDGYGLFFSRASRGFLVNIARDSTSRF